MSFNFDDDVEDDDETKDAEDELSSEMKKDGTSEEKKVPKKRKRLGKNPDVDTSFLPDVDREEAENKLRCVLTYINL